jgi:membrane protein DedA with SNARE-associated domain
MIAWVTDWVTAGGYAGIFALMFLENLFPPIPSEVIMPLAGFAAARGDLAVQGVLLAGLLGTLAGNAVWYEAARAIGAARIRALVVRFGRWFAVSEEDFDRAERVLRRYGTVAVFFGRMLPTIRTLISIPAGLIHMPRGLFYAWTAAGSLVWLGLLTGAGYLLEDHYDRVEGWIEPLGTAVILGVVAAYLWHLWRSWRRRAG